MTTAREHKIHRDSKSHKAPKDDRYEVRLSGSGGHGVILACVMLARAIGTDPRRNVVQTQSYGPEARGGRSKLTGRAPACAARGPKSGQRSLAGRHEDRILCPKRGES